MRPESASRVCHVSLNLLTGGMERLLVEFARFHDRRRFDPHFVTLEANLGRPAEDIREAGAPVHVLTGVPGERIAPIRRLVGLFRALRPDVVHTHNAYPQFYGALAARLSGVPVVVHTRHGTSLGASRRSRMLFFLAGRLANRIVGVSEDVARLSREQGRLPARKVLQVRNGVDLQRFRFRGPGPAPVAISVARLSSVKDFPTLLRALSIASAEAPDLRLRVVGEGPERHHLEAAARTMGIADRVEFLGERVDVPELLASAAFFVSSSLTEGISLTLLEAMAVGLPVLATAVGGTPEVVVDGATGILVPSADSAALAAGMVRLCRDRDLRQEMGRRGYERVAERFDTRKMVAAYETLYEELLGGS
jgi:sugar transferase (PEP-CTERM/EpsH1 system associated)